ncbi:MAG: ABC transporter permease [Eubacteriales bacterium]|nr:ABC transporter permease [Eubacteriales bacterium]
MNMKQFRSQVRKVTDMLGIWVVLILLFLVLSISTGKTFLQPSNLINLVRQICVTCLVAVGATFVVCGGEIDLSSGEMAALAGCFSAMLMVRYGWNTWTSILVVLAVGTLFGILTGLVVTILNVPSFIATLGMMYVLEGIVLLLTRGTPINGLHEDYIAIGRGYLGAIPIPVIIVTVIILVGAFIFKFTKFGRNIQAVGENATAANLSGINVRMIKIAIFAVGGMLSAAGGVMLTARLSSGQPTAAGDLSLQAMAGVFVGGNSATNSEHAMFNTLAGSLIIGMINNGMNLLEVNAYWQKVALGVIIISAIAMDAYRTQSLTKAS